MFPLQGKRIFCIEDDPRNRAIAQMILEQAGATVGFERWGRDETLTKLKAFAPVDIILLDLMFPGGISGYAIFDSIRSDAQFADVPIVAVSASDPAIEIPKARRKGFSGFISKPIDLRLFPQQVQAFIAGESLGWHIG